MTPETTMAGGFSLESAESAIEFRVLREGLPRRRIRLVGTRYTLGSGADCSVRLEDPQLLPLHATILREGVQVTVKAFGRAITVNGQARTESPLRPGDWFVLGSYRFEYLASGSTASSTASSAASSAPSFAASRGTVEQLPRDVDDAQGSGLAEAEVGEGHSRGRVIPRRRVSFSESMRTVVSQEPASQWTAASEDRSDLRERRAQLRSSLVAIDPEGRWQKRYAQQQRRYRERTERTGEQMQALRHAQESADRRARQAEEGMQSLQVQLVELQGKVTALAATLVPTLQQRLDQQQSETIHGNRQSKQQLDALSERFKRMQQELEAIEGETRALRQHAEVSEGQSQELSRATKQLEASLQELRSAQQGLEQGSEEALGELRGELLQITGRFTEFTAQFGKQSQHMERLGSSITELSASVEQMSAQAAEVVPRESLDPLRREIEQGQQQLAQLVAEFDAQGVHYEQELEELRQRMEWYEQRLGGSEPRFLGEDHSAMIEPSWDASSSFGEAQGDRPEDSFSEGVAEAIEGYSEGEHLEIDEPWEEIEGVAEEEETEMSALHSQRFVELREPVDELREPVDELREPVDELREPVDELREPVDELREPVVELCEPVVEQHDRVVEPCEAPAPAPQRTALSAAEVLARMGLSIDEDESDVTPQRPSPPRVTPQAAPSTSPARMDAAAREPHSASGGAEEGEEESIEAYMNRLLQRVQSGPEKTVVLESPPKVPEKAVERKVEVVNLPPLSAADEPARRTQATAPEMEADEDLGNEDAAPGSPEEAAPVLPKRPVSERIPNLAAMRELANSTARTAIAASAHRRLVNQAIYKFGISCGALVAGVTILVGTHFSMDYWMVIAVCCLLLSGFFFWESMLLRQRLRTSQKEYAASVAAHPQAGSPTAPA